MRERIEAPWPLWVAALAMLFECLAFFVRSVAPVDLVPLALGIAIAMLLIRGSRVAWVLCLVGAPIQIVQPLLSNEFPLWTAVTGIIVILCLLMPPSIRFIWKRRQDIPRNYGSWNPARLFAWPEAQMHGLAGRLTSKKPLPILEAKAIWSLVIAFIVLVPLIDEFRDYWEGAGQDSLLVNILWRGTWVSFSVFQIMIVVLLAAAAYRSWKLRSSSRGISAS